MACITSIERSAPIAVAITLTSGTCAPRNNRYRAAYADPVRTAIEPANANFSTAADVE